MNVPRATAAVAVAVALVAPGCGLGKKQEQADRIHAVPVRAVQQKVGTGTMTIEITPDPDNRSLQQQQADASGAAELLAQAGPGTAQLDYAVDFDFAKQRAQLSLVTPPRLGLAADTSGGETSTEAAGGAAAVPAVSSVFTGNTVFVRRLNLRPTEKRLWAKLDFTRLPEDEPRPQPTELEDTAGVVAAAHTLNPVYIVDLALGALAGSIEVAGREAVNGVETTKYDTNMSVERVLNELDLDDEDLEARLLMFRLLLGRTPDVQPAQFWVDDDGLLRRARFEFRQRIDRNEANDLVITLNVNTYGAEVGIPSPANDETVEVERYGRMVRASLPRRG